ncbi:MAG: hypothetical protein GHCLOJNM_02565 [bacterium]|nr:hypothetical protein [bacterium]
MGRMMHRHLGTVVDLLSPASPRRTEVTALAVALYVGLSAFLFFRTMDRLVIPGGDNTGRWAYAAYRDATYYPVRAFLEGKNPYDPKEYLVSYPVGDVLPPYLPMTLLIHLPFGLVSFKASAVLYLLFTLALTLVLAGLCLRMAGVGPTAARVLLLGTFILLTRPGQNNLLLGECTVVSVMATYATLFLARQAPKAASVAFAFACFKPTFGAPLGVLLLARRDWKVAIFGGLIAALLSAAAAGVIVLNVGLGPFVASALSAYDASEDHPDSHPASSPSRIDAKGLIGRLLGEDPGVGSELLLAAILLGLGGWGARLLAVPSETDESRSLAVTLTSLVILTSIFHQPYDLILLVFPLLSILEGWKRLPWSEHPFSGVVLALLLSFLLFNYLGSATALARLGIHPREPAWVLLSSAGGVALLAALGLALRVSCACPIHRRDQPS